MEYSLTIIMSNPIKKRYCLNPYSNGILPDGKTFEMPSRKYES